MRVTLDSNAWEKIFDAEDGVYAPLRRAFADSLLKGFICEAGFRIEAIRKADRASYFAQPAMEVRMPLSVVMKDGRPHIHLFSIGPDDDRHPGLPDVQVKKLRQALVTGIRFMRGAAWMSLPGPAGILDPSLFAECDAEREQRQILVLSQIDARGVGKSAFDAARGWQGGGSGSNDKALQKACAEWADGELVAAHIAYRNDILCTNDRARAAGNSIFDARNRAWLHQHFGVRFATLDELVTHITPPES